MCWRTNEARFHMRHNDHSIMPREGKRVIHRRILHGTFEIGRLSFARCDWQFSRGKKKNPRVTSHENNLGLCDRIDERIPLLRSRHVMSGGNYYLSGITIGRFRRVYKMREPAILLFIASFSNLIYFPIY